MEEEIELIAKDLMNIVDGKTKGYKISNVIKNTEGWETDIYFFTITTDNKVFEFALRIYLGDEKDSKSSAEKEFNLLRILNSTKFPVPKVYLIDVTCLIIPNPFIIMEKIIGKPLYSLLSSDKNQFAFLLPNFFILFHTLHTLSINEFESLFNINSTIEKYSFTHRVYYFLENRINGLQIEKIKRELNWLLAWAKNFHLDDLFLTNSVIHLDYHPNNVLVTNNNQELKVIDWNACAIGDFRFDIAWTQILSLPDYNYFNLIQTEYERVSNKKIKELDFFLVLMSLRRLTDAILSIEGNPSSLSMKTDTSDKMKQISDHYIAIIRKLEQLTKIQLPSLVDYF